LIYLFSPFRHIDDSAVAWASLKESSYKNSIPLDIVHARSWGLLHHAGCHTFAHHDAGGFCTIAAVRAGCKIWGVLRPHGYEEATSRTALETMAGDNFTRTENNDHELDYGYAKGAQVFAVAAKPGDIM